MPAEVSRRGNYCRRTPTSNELAPPPETFAPSASATATTICAPRERAASVGTFATRPRQRVVTFRVGDHIPTGTANRADRNASRLVFITTACRLQVGRRRRAECASLQRRTGSAFECILEAAFDARRDATASRRRRASAIPPNPISATGILSIAPRERARRRSGDKSTGCRLRKTSFTPTCLRRRRAAERTPLSPLNSVVSPSAHKFCQQPMESN